MPLSSKKGPQATACQKSARGVKKTWFVEGEVGWARLSRKESLTLRPYEGFTFDGLLIYTKGVIRKEFGQETLYILVSAKRST